MDKRCFIHEAVLLEKAGRRFPCSVVERLTAREVAGTGADHCRLTGLQVQRAGSGVVGEDGNDKQNAQRKKF